jgi:hypothetical protein
MRKMTNVGRGSNTAFKLRDRPSLLVLSLVSVQVYPFGGIDGMLM